MFIQFALRFLNQLLMLLKTFQYQNHIHLLFKWWKYINWRHAGWYNRTDTDETGSSIPHLSSQLEPSDLVRDLGLTREKWEPLVSRLEYFTRWCTKLHKCQKQHGELQESFTKKYGICCYCDVEGFLRKMVCSNNPEELQFFRYSSKANRKDVLQHNGNQKSSTPLAHNIGLNETYESTDKILHFNKYSEYK